jgi:hypothetical protein
MGKRNKAAEIAVVAETVAPVITATNTDGVDLTKLTKEELHLRRLANVAERERLAEENKYLVELYRSATSSAKMTSAENKIAALQAKLAALQNPPVVEAAPAADTVETPAELAM